ncbi:hypothetical protein LJR118_000589 [Acidovorax sp. LjRoot118]|uniref:hypothetical protein n=1 Tax=Acidovorax sp. LjRoot118 TaxID=3342256 RepID=UPI003ECE4463
MHTTAYEYQPSFILGFHGCSKDVADQVLTGAIEHLKPSEKEYDWLGHGIYFWEGNPGRAWEWALARQRDGVIAEPAVLGAIIDLKHCLDLFDHHGLASVKTTHDELRTAFDLFGFDMPKNVGKSPDKAGRRLDCAVLNSLHKLRERNKETAYDSVRAPFLEGDPLYEGAGFRSYNHIQICVRHRACIKGYFKPIIQV